jgi:hypothetical protein
MRGWRAVPCYSGPSAWLSTRGGRATHRPARNSNPPRYCHRQTRGGWPKARLYVYSPSLRCRENGPQDGDLRAPDEFAENRSVIRSGCMTDLTYTAPFCDLHVTEILETAPMSCRARIGLPCPRVGHDKARQALVQLAYGPSKCDLQKIDRHGRGRKGRPHIAIAHVAFFGSSREFVGDVGHETMD